MRQMLLGVFLLLVNTPRGRTPRRRFRHSRALARKGDDSFSLLFEMADEQSKKFGKVGRVQLGFSRGRLADMLVENRTNERFVVWSAKNGLQGELTIYGSGVYIISSERGSISRRH